MTQQLNIHANHSRRSGAQRLRQWLLQLAVPLLLWLMTPMAHALSSCAYDGAGAQLVAGDLTTPVNSAPGTLLKTVTNSFQIKCMDILSPSSATVTMYGDFKMTAAPVSGYTDVFPTSLDGLGVRYKVTAPNCNANSVVVGSLTTISCYFTLKKSQYTSYPLTVTTEFVRTSAASISAGAIGTVASPQYWVRVSDQPGGEWRQGDPFAATATGSVTAPSCSVVKGDQTVDLGRATVQQFPSLIGATTGALRSFLLSFNCPAGLTVAITLTDATDPSNQTSALKLASGSSASGFGVQILRSGAPVSLGPDSAVAGNVNQWLVTSSSASGVNSLPLSARYIRTGTVVPGSVKAVATFTMSYQ